MNPAFVILVVIMCVAIWFLASATYRPIGKFFFKIGKDAVDELTEEEIEE